MPPPPRAASDACPGALQLHHAADGALARVRIPGGALRGAQLGALADAAAALGDGHLELTSRGNVQLRGLAPEASGELAARLHAAGLLPSPAHERVRNIAASVLSGRDAAGRTDVRPLAAALDAALCADQALARLPGRFLFTLDDGRGDVIALRGDVGLYAVAADAFTLVLAGTDTGVRVPSPKAVAYALAVARRFLDVRAGAWRVAELPRAAVVLDTLPAPSAAPLPVPCVPVIPPLGVIRQGDGRRALSGLAPLGRLAAGQLRRLRGAAEVIVTPWRGVVVPDLAAVPGRSGAGETYGLVVEAASGWAGLTSCAGRPGCAKALADVRADAARTRRPVDGLAAGGLPVHWSGCERQCGRPAAPHVAVVATAEGYEVRRGEQVRARRADLTAASAAAAAARRGT